MAGDGRKENIKGVQNITENMEKGESIAPFFRWIYKHWNGLWKCVFGTLFILGVFLIIYAYFFLEEGIVQWIIGGSGLFPFIIAGFTKHYTLISKLKPSPKITFHRVDYIKIDCTIHHRQGKLETIKPPSVCVYVYNKNKYANGTIQTKAFYVEDCTSHNSIYLDGRLGKPPLPISPEETIKLRFPLKRWLNPDHNHILHLTLLVNDKEIDFEEPLDADS